MSNHKNVNDILSEDGPIFLQQLRSYPNKYHELSLESMDGITENTSEIIGLLEVTETLSPENVILLGEIKSSLEECSKLADSPIQGLFERCLELTIEVLSKNPSPEVPEETLYEKIKREELEKMINNVQKRDDTELRREIQADLFLQGLSTNHSPPPRDYRAPHEKELDIILSVNREVQTLRRKREEQLSKIEARRDNVKSLEELRREKRSAAEEAADIMIKAKAIEDYQKRMTRVPK